MEQIKTALENVSKVCETEMNDLRHVIEQTRKELQQSELYSRQLENDLRKLKEENQQLKDDNQSFTSVSRIISMTNENIRLKEQIKLLEQSLTNRNIPRSPVVSLKPIEKEEPPVPIEEVETVETPEPVKEIEPEPVEETKDPEPVEETKDPEPVEAPEPVEEPEQDVEEPIKETEQPQVEAPEPVEAPEEAEEPEEEYNVVEKKIKGVIYYLDDDDNIYQKLEDGEIGDAVGKYMVSEKTGKKKLVWYETE
jgi:hypothetical protein